MCAKKKERGYTDQTESILVVEIELVVGEQVLHSVQLIDLFLAAFHQLRRIKKNETKRVN